MGVQNQCLPRVIDTRASGFVITSPMLAKSDRPPFKAAFGTNFRYRFSLENPTLKATVYLLFVLLPVVLGRSLYVLLICQRNEDQLRINLSRSVNPPQLVASETRQKGQRNQKFLKIFSGKKEKAAIAACQSRLDSGSKFP